MHCIIHVAISNVHDEQDFIEDVFLGEWRHPREGREGEGVVAGNFRRFGALKWILVCFLAADY